MPTNFKTPGVYIEEKNAFPNSAVSVETAVPAFIGYTEKAEWYGKSLLQKPTRITSFAEYVERFGGSFQAKFMLKTLGGATDPKKTDVKETPETDKDAASADTEAKADVTEAKNETVSAAGKSTFTVGQKQMYAEIKANHTLYLFNCIRLFFANGGGPCYIIAVDTYNNKPNGIEVNVADFIGSDKKINPLELLKKEFEPTLVVVPDAIALGAACYNTIYTEILAHCANTQSRFAILDLEKQSPLASTSDVVGTFRNKIGVNNLKYSAAYYPWLKTAVVQPSEVTFENIDSSVKLADILPEDAAQKVVANFKPTESTSETEKLNFHQALKATSPTYTNILGEIRAILNELPPSAAMAGLYTAVDSSRGVWKTPANVSVNMVNAPSVDISSEQQEDLNVDVMAGKSINVIRTFPGIGTLVWGGRTLDGNSQDWRYINVRRTLIMIEQSLKLSARAYVFEPNDANTWVTVKCMMNNFLTNLWKQGALAGAVPEQAFDVQIGLGSTMTATDILDGKMLISVKVAIVRPAEFIVITFQQQMQQS